MPCAVLAASTADAKEPISTEKACTLTIRYHYEQTNFANETVRLYKVADVSADFQYTLTPAFLSSGLILNGVRSNGEWDVIRSTLEAHILANSIESTQTAVTNGGGQACFTQLTPGLYFASAVNLVQGDLSCVFDSALIALPGLGTDGTWQYQVEVTAKPEILPPIESDEQIELKVLKLWKGDEARDDRPQSVEVEIYRDGVLYGTVVLSENNYWSYSWTVKADGATWNVVERNVPAGYTMTVEQRQTTFILTNTRVPDDPDTPKPQPPKTGDTTNVLLLTLLMNGSGIMLIILGVIGKRMYNEETNETHS